MAAVVTTTIHRHNEARLDRDGAARHIQRVFRGHRARRSRSFEIVIEPKKLLEVLDRHKREREGFCHLLGYLIYSTLFLFLALSRLHPQDRYYFESNFAETMAGITTADMVTYDTVASTDDVYALLEVMITSFYNVGEETSFFGQSLPPEPVVEQLLNQSMVQLATREGLSNILESPDYNQLYKRSRAILQSMQDTTSTVGFSCIDTLSGLGFPPMILPLQPYEIAGQVTLMQREQQTGSAYPDPDDEPGQFMHYSVFTGPLLVEMVRREDVKCVVGEHGHIIKDCFSSDNQDPNSFVGEASNFTYHTVSEDTFYQLFDLGTFGLGVKPSQCVLETLDKDEWISPKTSQITASIGAINGNVQLIGRAEITWTFSLGGLVESDLKVASTAIPQHDVLGLYSPVHFLVVLIFMIWTVIRLVLVIIEIVKKKKLNFWIVVDLVLYALFFSMEAFHIKLTNEATTFRTPSPEEVMESTNQFEVLISHGSQMENMVSIEERYRMLVSCCYLLVLLRLLRMFQFHDRLAVITRTLAEGTSDLIHFGIIYVAVTVLYSAVCMNSFGSLMESFNSFTQAYTTLALALLGDFDYPGLTQVSPFMGPLIFWSYQLVVFFLLTNVFLSIIVDSYIIVKEQSNESSSFITSVVETVYAVFIELLHYKRSKLRVSPSPSRSYKLADAETGRATTKSMRQLMADKAQSWSASVHEPVRSKHLAQPLRDMALASASKCTESHTEWIHRIDVRKALGMQYSHATINAVMLTFGQHNKLDVQEYKAKQLGRRKRFQQKIMLRSLTTLEKKVNLLIGDSVSATPQPGRISESKQEG